LAKLKKINFSQKLNKFVDEEGNEGRQYYAQDAGYIDLLAKDKEGNFIVIKLKKGRKNDEVIGQVLRYVGWVKSNLAKNSEEVHGMIIVGDRDKKLEYGLEMVKNLVSCKIYKINFKLDEY